MPEARVLIAVDNSSEAELAFQWFMDHYYQPEHKIIIAHCNEHPITFQGPNAAAYSTFFGQMELLAKEVKTKYSRLMEGRGVNGTFVSAIRQHAPSWIVEKATEESASLIVLGSRGMGTIRRTLLGSVSDYVLHHAHCPVAVYRVAA